MCRLFGFRSVIQSQVHRSLIGAENALGNQSTDHPDGWGVAYYVSGSPHLIKSAQSALGDTLFSRISGIVSSETVLAHLRKATSGAINTLNTHPFQHGRWVFAHNGNIKNFTEHRAELIARITPQLRRFILGDTDSEVLFFMLLSQLSACVGLNTSGLAAKVLAEATRSTIKELVSVVGDFHAEDSGPPDLTYLTFLLTDGETMIAHHGGKNLFYSTYKKSCGDRDVCPSYGFECENATKTGFINHLIFSSEPLSGENIWIPLNPGQIVGVDIGMKMAFY